MAGKSQAQAVLLGGDLSLQSTLHDSFITGQRGMGLQSICQESAAFASGYLGLAIFGCAGLTSYGHIGQSRGEKKKTKK